MLIFYPFDITFKIKNDHAIIYLYGKTADNSRVCVKIGLKFGVCYANTAVVCGFAVQVDYSMIVLYLVGDIEGIKDEHEGFLLERLFKGWVAFQHNSSCWERDYIYLNPTKG